MKIYTKTGDKGSTSLFGGKRVSKHNLRIEAYGTLDELLAYTGLVRDYIDQEDKDILIKIQNTLFNVGSHLATPMNNDKAQSKLPNVSEDDIVILENEMDNIDKTLEPMTNFVLPGGHPTVSHCHVARTICRRAERRISALADIEEIDGILIKYVNRLSDYLFILSRKYAEKLEIKEVIWNINSKK